MRSKVLLLVFLSLVLLVAAPVASADPVGSSPTRPGAVNGADLPAVFYTWARVERNTYTYSSASGDAGPLLEGNGSWWVTVRGRQAVNGETWYQTATGRWVRARDVRVLYPSQFQGYHYRGDEQGDLGFILENNTHVHAQPHGDARDIAFLRRYTPVGLFGLDNGWFRIGQGQWVWPKFVRVVKPQARPQGVGPDHKWIDVNLTQQTVVAYEGDQPVFATLTSTGKRTTPTIKGFFHIYEKLISTPMFGNSETGTYGLEDVPWTMYFTQRYALHGAYWHDAFGEIRSAGCVNLSPVDAKWLFNWSGPVLPAGQTRVFASANNPGTWVYVHD